MDAPAVLDVPSATDDEPTDAEKQAVADAREQVNLAIQAAEENWALDDRLDYLLKTG
jgi:hypothetical protein